MGLFLRPRLYCLPRLAGRGNIASRGECAEAILPPEACVPRRYCLPRLVCRGNIASRGVCAEAILPPEAWVPRQYCLPRRVCRGDIASRGAEAILPPEACFSGGLIFRDAFLGQQKCNSPLVSKSVFLRYDLFIWFYILISAKMTGPRSKFYSVLIIRIN